ncbi:MAG: hypothetical protein JWN14_1429, partial [Chthonomonadales bacterium]|nr:hypothetical protein [Chthonomonadales bacterium]
TGGISFSIGGLICEAVDIFHSNTPNVDLMLGLIETFLQCMWLRSKARCDYRGPRRGSDSENSHRCGQPVKTMR